MSAAQAALIPDAAVETAASSNGGMSATPGTELSASPEPIDISSLEQRTLNPESFLYSELAKSHLGERASAVLSVLVNKGRLSTREIHSFIPELSMASIKTVLVSLIQLRCVQYMEETSLSGRKTLYYYFNEEGLFLMLYAGDIGNRITEYFNSEEEESLINIAQQIVLNVLSLGSLTVKNFMASFEPLSEDGSMFHVHQAFVKLAELELLVPLQGIHYTPIVDLWNMLFLREYKKLPTNTTQSDLKKRNEAKAKAKLEFNRIVSSPTLGSNGQMFLTDAATGFKKVNESISLTFNLDRYLKTRRSNQLVQFAQSRIGTTSSKIYAAALSMTEQNSNELSHPLSKTGLFQDLDERTSLESDLKLDEESAKGVSFSALDVAKRLPKSLDLRGSLVLSNQSSKRKQKHRQSPQQPEKRIKTEDGFAVPPLPTVMEESEEEEQEGDNSNLDFDEDQSDPHSLSLVNGHLRLLLTANIPFIKETKPGQFYVPYSTLIPILKTYTYDSVIASTLGPSSHRVLKCIRDNGLCSERTITTTSLMREKDVRTVIGTLVKYNAIEIQEVPRTADRAASRAVFLFRIKEKHAFNAMKQNLTWNLARLISKLETLKEENATLLKKANRDDVKGREMELLLASEINQLKLVNDRELNGLVRRHRLISLWEVFKLF
ncbi:unnamed protein product [Kluyveromyces dobzhanskii CBS 2104]|uniref:DNA-directed RNA polymerase III subunit RPC3 n=1 Tax=Kluyveromyces dobzhanskii CBS 2104 TaxID=1427455 RepID=A0A0A8L1V7_9SACH|nr:unnamed protein product [Kluyveromyces dobzhanskii CBS 2104]